MQVPLTRPTDEGFSLVEAIIAMGILAVGVLALAQGFILGLSHLSTSSANLVAREKAREAVESVHTARDTRTIAWDRIRNTGAGGVFVEGLQPLRAAGVDGLVNTADDAAAGLEMQQLPGPDDQLGTADDVMLPLDGFQRQVEILELAPVNPDLREIQVTIVYTVASIRRTYTLRTFISSFS